MTKSIVAPAPLVVDARPLSLALDVPLPVPPPAPTRRALAALTSTPHVDRPVPAGADPGSLDVEQVLYEIVPDIEALRRKLRDARPAGFLVSASDSQRAREVARLLGETAAILAERA